MNKISSLESGNISDPLDRHSSSVESSGWLKRLLIWGCMTSIVVMMILVALISWALRSIQMIPREYQAALDMPVASAIQQGDELERSVLQMHNAIDDGRPWKVTFTADQINGWLATDLVEKFPEALPTGVSQPRVVLRSRSAQLLFQYQLPGDLKGVATAEADIFVTDQPNQLAVEIQKIRSGPVHLPIAPWLDSICNNLRRQGIDATWTFHASNPTVLINVPETIEGLDAPGTISLDSVEVLEDAITIAGTSENQP